MDVAEALVSMSGAEVPQTTAPSQSNEDVQTLCDLQCRREVATEEIGGQVEMMLELLGEGDQLPRDPGVVCATRCCRAMLALGESLGFWRRTCKHSIHASSGMQRTTTYYSAQVLQSYAQWMQETRR